MKFPEIVFLFFCLLCVACCASRKNSHDALNYFLNKAKDKNIISEDQYKEMMNMLIQEENMNLHQISNKDLVDDSKAAVFVLMYNQLTLLNVLYFSGSLLIMGAYSLLMTLAFEHFSKMNLANIIAFQTGGFGMSGVLLWNTNYQFLGGLLVSISTSMVPYTIYCYQRALNYWPSDDPGTFMDFRIYIRSGWVNMEIGAIIVGLTYLYLAPFPFLLAPISFALWFLSMDIAPLFRGFHESCAYEFRRKVSLGFGIVVIILGRVLELALGSDPDFGFWPYLFGLITFWFALISYPPTNDPMAHTVFFLTNIALVLIGSHLDRITFHLFGTIGVALMTLTYLKKDQIIKSSFVLWILKGLAAASLLSNAIRTGGSIEIFNSAVCFGIFNMEGLLYLPKGEKYYLFILLTNLGFVSTLPSFDSHPLNFWLFQIPSASVVMSIACLSVCIYHIKILQYYQNRFNLNRNDMLFLTYRIFVNVSITLVFLFFKQNWWAFVGSLGIPLIAMLTQPNERNDPVTWGTLISQYSLLLLSIFVALFFDSNLLYLISCLCMGATIMVHTQHGNRYPRLACVLAILLIFFAVPLQSKFIIAIGGIYIFIYLSNLAYTAFKNSVMFPLTLIGLGISLIAIGIIYQAYQDSLYHFSLYFIPVDWLHTLNQYILNTDWYSLLIKDFRFIDTIDHPYVWFLWPGPLVQGLSKEQIPFASVFCGLGIVVVMLAMSYMKAINEYCPDLTDEVKVSSLVLNLDQKTGSGFIVKITGTKPSQLEQPQYISLNMNGSMFWRTMTQTFGSIPVKLIRSAILPYQLTPSLITFTTFNKGSTEFTAIIEIGNGKMGKPSFSHKTITNNCNKVKHIQSSVECVLLYSNAMYLPYAPLCSYETNVLALCQMLASN